MIKLKELLSFQDPINSKLRIHLSPNPIDKLSARPGYTTQNESPISKPTGFWYGFGKEWIDLVYGEQWESRYGNYIYFVKIKNPSKMLFISNREGMDFLNEKYYVERHRNIDWKQVSNDYSGIEINPFQGKLYRESGDYGWYGGWDVASGCVWDINILDLKQIYPKPSATLKEDTNPSSEIASFENSIKSKYSQYIEQFHIYYDDKSNSLFLTDIYIKQQFKGRGWGSKIMKDVVNYADSKKLVIQLVPAAESFKASSIRRLVNFYKRFGFNENKDFWKNPAYDEMGMYRVPQ